MEKLNVLITGASSGIGYELAKIFARKNYNLILVARNKERLEAISSELAEPQIHIMIINKDLTRPEAAMEIYEETVSRKLSVHVLVNCAGTGLYGHFHQSSMQRQLQMIQLNMVALTQLTHLFAQDMVDRKFGKILNVGSISSYVSTPMMSAYAATKAYVLSFSESIRSELSEKGDISVTALCPGFTKTNFIKEADLGHMEAWLYKFSLSPAVVAQHGYEALSRRKPVSIVGRTNQFLVFVSRFVPRPWVHKLVMFIFKKRAKY